MSAPFMTITACAGGHPQNEKLHFHIRTRRVRGETMYEIYCEGGFLGNSDESRLHPTLDLAIADAAREAKAVVTDL